MANGNGGQGTAAALLGTVLGLSSAIREQQAHDAAAVESFTRMAALAPDPTTLSRLVSTYTRVTGGRVGPDTFTQMADQLAARQESLMQRELLRGYTEAEARGEGVGLRTDLTDRTFRGRFGEDAFFGGLRMRLGQAGEAALTPESFAEMGRDMLGVQHTGMTSGAAAEDAAIDQFFNGIPEDAATAIKIRFGLLPDAGTAGSLDLQNRAHELNVIEAADRSAQWQSQLGLMRQQAEQELQSAQSLTPDQRLQYTNAIKAAQEFMTVNESKLTQGQREMLTSEINYLMTILNRDAVASQLPLHGGPRVQSRTQIGPTGNTTIWEVPGGAPSFAPRDVPYVPGW